jgi:hypothetical protein
MLKAMAVGVIDVEGTGKRSVGQTVVLNHQGS